MKNPIITIMKKELARFFGDKRMVLTTIFLPGIMIYLVYSLMGSAMMSQFTNDDTKYTAVAVYAPSFVRSAAESAGIEITEADDENLDSTKKEIKDGTTDLMLVFPSDFEEKAAGYEVASGEKAPNIEVYYNSSETKSQSAYSMMGSILDTYESSMANKFDVNNQDGQYDLADADGESKQFFSMFLPLLLLMFMFSGCMSVAPESIAGEKERGTIANLLITPTKRSSIALGKIFALSIIAILGGASSTIGTMLALPKLLGDAEGINASVYGFNEYACLALVALSTVLLFITAISIISAFAKNVKEASGYIVPLMVVIMLVGVTGMFANGIKTDMVYYLIPAYNSVQCMMGIFSLDTHMSFMLITVISNIIYSGLGVFALTKMFNSEKIIFSK